MMMMMMMMVEIVLILPPVLPIYSPGLTGLFQGLQLQWVSTTSSTVFSALWQNPDICQFFHFLFYFSSMVSMNDKIHKTGWSVWISKSLRISFVKFSRTDSDVSIYHLSVWPIFNLLHNPTVIPVGYGCRIHRLHIFRGVKLPQRVSWYDIK